MAFEKKICLLFILLFFCSSYHALCHSLQVSPIDTAQILETSQSPQSSYISKKKPIRQFGIDLGAIQYQLRDDIIAPLRWAGIGFVGTLSYSIIGDKGRHKIELRVPFSTLSNRYDHKSTAMEINLSYRYLQRIAGDESPEQLHLGGLIEWSCNLQYYNNWDDSHLYWLNAYQLGPAVRWSKTIKDKNQLNVNFNFPLFALVSRPPEHRYYDQERLPSDLISKPHEEMKLTSVHEYISFQLRGDYMHQVNRKFTVGVSYLFNYKTFSEPVRITLFTNTLQLNLLFTLGKIQKEES